MADIYIQITKVNNGMDEDQTRDLWSSATN